MSKENKTSDKQQNGNDFIADVMAMFPDEEMIKKLSSQYIVNNNISGGDAGWIEHAYRDGIRDLIEMIKNN